MPKISNKEESIRYLTRVADLFKKHLIQKYGPDPEAWGERYIGEAEIDSILKRVGERAKDVFTGIVRKFNVETFKDSDGEVVFLVVDRKKIKVKARRVS